MPLPGREGAVGMELLMRTSARPSRTRVKLGRAEILISNTVSAAPSRPGNGMALNNVRERLRLMHDVAAQFETRREARSFRVQIMVPLQ